MLPASAHAPPREWDEDEAEETSPPPMVFGMRWSFIVPPVSGIVVMASVHCAYRTTTASRVDARFVTSALFLYIAPLPSALVFQPVNVSPDLAYRLAGSAAFASYATVRSAIVPDEAPLPSNLTL